MDSRKVGRRADQYALGCTLYHLLTGQVPFPDGNPISRAVARLTGTPRAVDEVRRGLPAGLGSVVARLLARLPKDRFPTARAAADALAPFAVPVSVASSDTGVNLPTVPDMTPLPDGP